MRKYECSCASCTGRMAATTLISGINLSVDDDIGPEAFVNRHVLVCHGDHDPPSELQAGLPQLVAQTMLIHRFQ